MQDLMTTKVLQDRARDIGEDVRFVSEDQLLPTDEAGLKIAVQRKNASLAIAITQAFLKYRAPPGQQELTAEDVRIGIQQWSWPGRFQIIPDDERTWFLDAAHNEMSIGLAVDWFGEAGASLATSPHRILIFSHISESRDSTALLSTLAMAVTASNVQFQHVIFTTYDETEEGKSVNATQDLTDFNRTWTKFYPHTTIWNEPTIRAAVQRAQSLGHEGPVSSIQILITGSQHLVGPALRILQSDKALHEELRTP